MASSSSRNIKVDTKMYEKPEELKTRLSECTNEFQEKFKQRHAPPPTIIRAIPNQGMEYNVLDEMKHVHQLIKDNGEQGDFGIQMKFGDLLPIYGTDKIDKLAEVLANARKNGFMNYTLNGFLEQDRDEDVYIRLIKTPF